MSCVIKAWQALKNEEVGDPDVSDFSTNDVIKFSKTIPGEKIFSIHEL